MLTLAEIDIDTWLMLIFGGHGCVYGSWIFGILAACYARVSPQAIDFSDDEDFFERAGEDDEDLLPFEGYECYQPPVEMPPEDELSLDPIPLHTTLPHPSYPPHHTPFTLLHPSQPTSPHSIHPTQSASYPTPYPPQRLTLSWLVVHVVLTQPHVATTE